ncbi:MAG: SelT/SelW/SelH family protein [Chloroflexi bacterium]|nr:SelT/SelW/SelH family protein [Chloroflexota bacterium]
MASELIMKWPENIAHVNLHAGSGGAYEVSVNGEQIWSKLESKQYPELKVVTDAVQAALG